MRINVDQILAVLGHELDELDVDGKPYRLKTFSLLDVASIENLRTRKASESDEQLFDRMQAGLRDLFDGDAPACLSEPLPKDAKAQTALGKKILSIAGVVIAMIQEADDLGNLMARVQQLTMRQIAEQRAGS